MNCSSNLNIEINRMDKFLMRQELLMSFCSCLFAHLGTSMNTSTFQFYASYHHINFHFNQHIITPNKAQMLNNNTVFVKFRLQNRTLKNCQLSVHINIKLSVTVDVLCRPTVARCVLITSFSPFPVGAQSESPRAVWLLVQKHQRERETSRAKPPE